MAEATTRGVPSRRLREYIARQTRVGRRLSAEATGFVLHLGWIKEGFDREVDPLHLSDEDYEAVVTESGLRGLLDMTHNLAEYLEEAVSAA